MTAISLDIKPDNQGNRSGKFSTPAIYDSDRFGSRNPVCLKMKKVIFHGQDNFDRKASVIQAYSKLIYKNVKPSAKRWTPMY